MGSPLGPTLANSFLSYHEADWLTKCPKQFCPVFYRRYVDDIFMLFKSEDHIKKFQKYLNSRHKNMKFTVEIENNYTLSFLDIKVSRSENKFITSLYRKPTFSGVYTNFNSFIPINYKRGLIFSLLFRVFNICSDYHLIHQEIEKLKTIWGKNSYPKGIIDSCINIFLDKMFVKKVIYLTVPKKQLVISLEYLGVQSVQVRKRLQQAFRDYMPFCNLKVVFSAKNRLSNKFTFKDKIPNCMKSAIIYKFTCSDCNATYIGKTNRHFQVRYSEHLGISKLTNKDLKYNKQSTTAVRDHLRDCNHKASSENFKIISNDNNKINLLIKESLNIYLEDPVLNKTLKSFPLYLF